MIKLGCPYCAIDKSSKEEMEKHIAICNMNPKNTNRKETIMNQNENLMDKVRSFYKNHENTILIVFILLILDYFFNDAKVQNKLRNKTKGLLESFNEKFFSDDKETEKKENK
jgi:hypothetical protein